MEMKCYVCGSPYVEQHHIFFGTANRRKSDEYGFIIPLCAEHHRGDRGVHFNKQLDRHLKQMAQRQFEETRDRADFIRIFGRSYL